MRINLSTRYEERFEAKSLGAKWDPARKTWYIVDIEDLTPFMRWIDRPNSNRSKREIGLMRSKAKLKKPRETVSVYKPHCGCYHVLPWEDCEHTLAWSEDFEKTELDIEAERHLRSL
jgi:hypothetical protein